MASQQAMPQAGGGVGGGVLSERSRQTLLGAWKALKAVQCCGDLVLTSSLIVQTPFTSWGLRLAPPHDKWVSLYDLRSLLGTESESQCLAPVATLPLPPQPSLAVLGPRPDLGRR